MKQSLYPIRVWGDQDLMILLLCMYKKTLLLQILSIKMLYVRLMCCVTSNVIGQWCFTM